MTARNSPMIRLWIIGLGMFTGCSLSESKTDTYKGLIGSTASIVDERRTIDLSTLRKSTAYLVTGANFENFIKNWREKESEIQKSILPMISEEGLALTTSPEGARESRSNQHKRWSPQATTTMVVSSLKKHFAEVVVARDLAEAREKKARWIIVFDHAFEWQMPILTDAHVHENTSTVDLLDGNLRRLVSARHADTKTRSALFDDGLIIVPGEYYARHRANDIISSIEAALQDFDRKLAVAGRP